MNARRVIRFGAIAWAFAGAAVAVPWLATVDAAARVVVGVLTVIGPLAALGAAHLLARGHDRAAGALLLLSALTPTYFAYVLNVPALLVGLGLVTGHTASHRFACRRHLRST